MVTVRDIFKSFQKIGIMPLQDEGIAPWKKKLYRVFVCMHFSMLCISSLMHLYSTVTRSTRYMPEFYQALFEDSFGISGVSIIAFMSLSYDRFLPLLKFMEDSFSRADILVIRRCEQQSKAVYTSTAYVLAFIALSPIVECLLPLSDKELEIRRMVYQTKHPERRHPVNYKIPYVDESESWVYEFLFVFYVSENAFFMYSISLVISILPVALLHVQGQYEILAGFIRKIGRKHTDLHGRAIFYTNIDSNDFQYVSKKKKYPMIVKQQYEQNYIKQIVMFHQKLLIFHEMVQNIL